MTRRILIPLAVAAAATAVVATASGAGAGNPNLIRLKVGDAVDVLNTRVACFAISSSGKNGVACVIWSKGKPLVGSYGVGLSVDGTAVLNRIKADGTSQEIFKKRLPASAAGARTVHKVKVGEGFGLPAGDGVILGCQVLNVTSKSVGPLYRGPKVSCWLATTTKPVPNRYGVSISDKMGGVFRFTPQGALSTWGVVRRQPAG